jgi:acylphosphatase
MGYRRFIVDNAQDLGIFGYVKNEKDGSVTVFAQGEEQRLNEFLKRIKVPPQPITVKKFTEKAAVPNKKIKHFEVKFGSIAEELQEGFGAMEKEFRDYRDEFRDYREEFKDYREEFRDYRQEFRGFAERTDESFKTLGEKYGEISEKLTQVLETLQKESLETRKELTRAVDTLSELVRQFLGRQKQAEA